MTNSPTGVCTCQRPQPLQPTRSDPTCYCRGCGKLCRAVEQKDVDEQADCDKIRAARIASAIVEAEHLERILNGANNRLRKLKDELVELKN